MSRPRSTRASDRRAEAGGPRRVLFLVDQYEDPYGGTEGQIHALLAHLPEAWHAELWVLQGSRWLETHSFPVPTRSLHLRSLTRPLGLLRILALGGAVRRGGFDLIHTWMNDAGLVGPLLGRRAGVPVVLSRRDLGFWETPRRLAALRRTDRLAASVIANCQAVATHVADAEHVPPGLIGVVANGQDMARFGVSPEPDLRRKLGIPEDARLLGLLANVKPLKRHDDLLDALVLLRSEHPDAYGDVYALLIGDEVDADVPLPTRIRARGLEGRVHALVASGNAIPMLRHLDLGVLCSETEGLSNAILEYLGASLPVVATTVGGNPELVAPGENGFLYEPGDVPALTGHLRRLLDDEGLRERMGRASRRRLEGRFTVARMVDGTTAAWEEALAGPPEPPPIAWRVLETAEALEDVADAWRALLEPSRFFAGPEWVLSFLESGPGAGSPHVLAGFDPDGGLRGVLPLVRAGADLTFAGAGLGADHLDVVARTSHALPVARSALRFLASRPWRRLRLAHLSEDGALRRAIRESGAPFPYREAFATTCPYVRIEEGMPFDAYVATRFSKASRRNIRRYPRRFRALRGARVERVVDAAAAASAVDRYYVLHGARARSRGLRSSMAGRRVQAFHRRLATRAAEQGRLVMTFLKLGGRDVACEYAFRHGDRMYAFQSGFDPSTPLESPGVVLQAIVLEEDVFAEGLSEYDFLDGAEDYKRRWATGERRLFDVVVHRPTPVGRAACLAAGVPYLARDLVRASS